MKIKKLLIFIFLSFFLLSFIALGFAADQQKPVRYMFVQTAQSGTFTKVEGKTDLYVLTLYGVSPQTIAFSDRPERIVGQVPMEAFLKGLGFSPKNPPNAAIEVLDAKEEEDLIVVELFDPKYDPEKHTLTYKFKILETPHHSYAIFNQRADKKLPEKFDAVTLYIDGCPDLVQSCCSNSMDDEDHSCCGYRYGVCWSWAPPGCFSACHPSDLEKCKEKCGDHCKYRCKPSPIEHF